MGQSLSKLTVTIEYESATLKTVRFSLCVYNESDKPLPASLRFCIEPTPSIFAQSVPIGSVDSYSRSKEITITLNLKPEAQLDTMSPAFCFKLVEDTKGLYSREYVFPNYYPFVRPILDRARQEYGDTGPCNILVLGSVGAGKSSFCGTVATILHPLAKSPLSPLSAGGSMEHCTTTLQQLNAPELYSWLNVYDTRGIGNDGAHDALQYTPAVLKRLLYGTVPVGTDVTRIADLPEPRTANPARQTHAVIFMLAAADLKGQEMPKMRKCFQNLLILGYNPVLVISRADETEPAFRVNPSATYPKLRNLRQQVAQAFGVGACKVFLGLNYLNEQTRSFKLEQLNMRILAAVYESALAFKHQHPLETTSTSTDSITSPD